MSAGQADFYTHTRSSRGVINTVPPLHVYTSINGHRGDVLTPAQMSLLTIFLIATLCTQCSPLLRAAIALVFIPVTFACSVFYLEKNDFKQDEETFLSHCATVTVTQLSSKPTWSSMMFQLNNLPQRHAFLGII